MTEIDLRQQILNQIKENIENSGRHIYNVMGGDSPRYLYTIGLSEKVGHELVLAGSITIPAPSAATLLNKLAELLEEGAEASEVTFDFEDFGVFTLAPVHQSWVKGMLLGALDYYSADLLPALQVIPEEGKRLIDHPDMSKPFQVKEPHVWSWLTDGPPPPFGSFRAITNLDALKGHAISELMRWEQGEWEMFSGPGPDVPQDEMYVVPLSTMMLFDPSLRSVIRVPVGKGLFREFSDDGVAGPWQPWEPKRS